VNVAKINVLFNVFNSRSDNNKFVVVVKIEEIYVDDVSSSIDELRERT